MRATIINLSPLTGQTVAARPVMRAARTPPSLTGCESLGRAHSFIEIAFKDAVDALASGDEARAHAIARSALAREGI